MGVALAGISVTGIVLLIVGWFKASSFFFLKRYGVKKAPLIKVKKAPYFETASDPLEVHGQKRFVNLGFKPDNKSF